jgi:hypothetical protein
VNAFQGRRAGVPEQGTSPPPPKKEARGTCIGVPRGIDHRHVARHYSRSRRSPEVNPGHRNASSTATLSSRSVSWFLRDVAISQGARSLASDPHYSLVYGRTHFASRATSPKGLARSMRKKPCRRGANVSTGRSRPHTGVRLFLSICPGASTTGEQQLPSLALA